MLIDYIHSPYILFYSILFYYLIIYIYYSIFFEKAYVDPPCINPYDCSMTLSVRRFYSNSFYAIAGRDLVVSGSNAD